VGSVAATARSHIRSGVSGLAGFTKRNASAPSDPNVKVIFGYTDTTLGDLDDRRPVALSDQSIECPLADAEALGGLSDGENFQRRILLAISDMPRG
jgi:hypothetical protein